MPRERFETMIERVQVDRYFGRYLDEWKVLRKDGWDVSAVIAPDSRTVVFLACRRARLEQIRLF